MLFVDDYTRMTWAYLLNKKSEAFDYFKHFRKQVEKELGMKIKCLRSDNGGEFTSSEFDMYYANKGIQRHLSTARTPQQNGVVERKNRTVTEMARSMLQEAKLDKNFWCQAVPVAIHILNKSLLGTNSEKTPYELWTGRRANLKYFRVFGSKCYIKRTDKNLGKFDPRTDEGIFLGYSCKRKACASITG